VYAIELDDERLLERLADFLTSRAAGTISHRPGRIDVRLWIVRPAQERLGLQRLLLAFQRETRTRLPPALRLTHVLGGASRDLET
jgi:hypothetical protein